MLPWAAFLSSTMGNRCLASVLLLCYLALVESRYHLRSFTRGTSPAQTNHKHLTNQDLDNSFIGVKQQLSKMAKLENKLESEGKIVARTSKVADASLLRSVDGGILVEKMEKSQLPFQIATGNLIRKYNLSSNEVNEALPQVSLTGERSQEFVAQCSVLIANPSCQASSKYRTINATCNNLQNPRWGSAFECFQRLLPASYVGESGFRQSVTGGPLPEPRTLSLNIHNNLNLPSHFLTHMYMFFGQLLDHDITLTPFSTTASNEALQCCPPSAETYPQCMPIAISPRDPFYSRFGITCLNLARSSICATCELGYRNQMNQITAFVDASFVYGSTDVLAQDLRMNDGTGRLRAQISSTGDLLPASPNPTNDQCSIPSRNEICFAAGDPRSNQHTTLTALQTLFLREHNRIVGELQKINPNYDDETLYQETRRILAAEMQAITYKEYLPLTLSSGRMSYFGLYISNGGSTVYDRNVNPTLYTEFSTAAFRFGHSMVNSYLTGGPTPPYRRQLLRDVYFEPFELYNGVMGPLLKGVSEYPAQQFDRHMVPDVTNFLYRIRGNATGLDLASFNIQRGRDNGMQPYSELVFFCSNGNIRLTRFQDLVSTGLTTQANANRLALNYRNVQDIDMWTGILNEIPMVGSPVGPTAACVIGLQFHNLKYGDRFYFEHRNQEGSFTLQQINQLRNTTLSQLICINTGGDVTEIQRNAMLFGSRSNPTVPCNSYQGIDLSYWKT